MLHLRAASRPLPATTLPSSFSSLATLAAIAPPNGFPEGPPVRACPRLACECVQHFSVLLSQPRWTRSLIYSLSSLLVVSLVGAACVDAVVPREPPVVATLQACAQNSLDGA